MTKKQKFYRVYFRQKQNKADLSWSNIPVGTGIFDSIEDAKKHIANHRKVASYLKYVKFIIVEDKSIKLAWAEK